LTVIFAILDYYAIRGTQLGSFVETLVAIFLPLSSMWASTNVKSKNIGQAMHEKGDHRAIPVGHSDFGTGAGSTLYSAKKQLMDDDTIDTLVNRTPTSSYNKSPTKHEPRNEPRVSVTAGHRLSCLSDGDEDLELGKLGKSIHVDKSYTVLSEPDWAVGRAR
jgi:pheromone alpha factor receptor